jgi:hypothetical protein
VLNKKWWNQHVVNACLEVIKEQRNQMEDLAKDLIN